MRISCEWMYLELEHCYLDAFNLILSLASACLCLSLLNGHYRMNNMYQVKFGSSKFIKPQWPFCIYIYISLFTHFYFGMCKNNESFFHNWYPVSFKYFLAAISFRSRSWGKGETKIRIIVLLISSTEDAGFVLTSEGKLK